MTGSELLVAGDTNNSADVFLYDVGTGVTSRVSVAAAGSQADNGVLQGWHSPAAISDDGRTIAFSSSSTNLVPGVGSASNSLVYVRDLRRRTTTLVSARPTQPGSTDAVARGWFAARC
ncbi:hypothetical protein ACPPVO_47355 [Dactylosporangium sp. McL0621]|uniref:hypothetical protein n=1 Tax=Dactylosporangium sp. McL0621 TaxID=3415678 RepID=UPI003CE94FBB